MKSQTIMQQHVIKFTSTVLLSDLIDGGRRYRDRIVLWKMYRGVFDISLYVMKVFTIHMVSWLYIVHTCTVSWLCQTQRHVPCIHYSEGFAGRRSNCLCSVMALQEDDDNFHSVLSMLKDIDINTVYMDSLIFRKRRYYSYSEISMEAGTFSSYSSIGIQWEN